MLSTTRRLVQQTISTRAASCMKKRFPSSRAMSDHSHGHGHGHHAHPDTSYDPALNAKFNLPPVPKDGVFRRRAQQQNIEGEAWSRDADFFFGDATEMVPITDRNGPRSLTPQQGLARTLGAITLTGVVAYGIPSLIGPAGGPNIHPTHPGPLPELLSIPNVHARQVVVEY